MPADLSTTTAASRAKARWKYFGGYGQSNRSQDEDVWTKQGGDRVVPPLPPATDSDVESMG